MKRVLASILSLVLMITSIGSTVFANSIGYPETVGNETSEWLTADELTLLRKLDIATYDTILEMEGNDERIMSRGYMAWYCARLVEMDTTKPAKYETLFDDLSTDNSFYPYIKGSFEAGFMNGYPDGKFRTDEPLTTMDAARVLLRVIGWEPIISVLGMDKALLETGILDGVPIADTITQAQLLKMIYNTLFAPAIKTNAFSTVKDSETIDVTYTIDEDYLGFEHLFGVIAARGVVDAIPGTTLTKVDNSMKENTVSIDGRRFDYDGDVIDLLGYSVQYFYKETAGNKWEILYIKKSDRNEELTLDHNEYTYSNGVYTHYKGNNSTRTIVLPNQIKIIYNDVANPQATAAEFEPQFGTVTFIDNNSDGKWDVLKIESFEFFYVSKNDTNTKRIYDLETNPNASPAPYVDYKDADFLTLKSGDKILNIDRIKVGAIIAVQKPGSKVTGVKRITMELIDATEKNVALNGIGDDKLSTQAKTYKTWNNLDRSKLQLGSIYNIFEFRDEVVGVYGGTTTSATDSYLVDVSYRGVFEAEIKFAIADTDGKITIYDAAKKVMIDGVSKNGTGILATLSTTAQESAGYDAVNWPYAQPIRFKTNSQGLINYIDTLAVNAVADENAMKDTVKGQNAKYTEQNSTFYTGTYTGVEADGILATLSSNTKIVFINAAERMDEMLYNIGTMKDDGVYNIDIIGREEICRVPELVYVYNNEVSKMDHRNNGEIVYEVREELNADGDVVYVLETYFNAQAKTYTCPKDKYVPVDNGDMVKIAANPLGEVTEMLKIFDVSEVPEKNKRVTWIDSNNNWVYSDTTALEYPLQYTWLYWKLVYGTVCGVNGNVLAVSQSLNSDPGDFDPYYRRDNFVNSFGGAVYVYEKGEVRKGSMNDIIPYSIDPENASVVLINVIYSQTRQIYVIK